LKRHKLNRKTGEQENRKTGEQENRKTGKPENRKTGKPENRKTGKQENIKPRRLIRIRLESSLFGINSLAVLYFPVFLFSCSTVFLFNSHL